MRFLSLLLCSLIVGQPIWARSDSADTAEAAADVPLHVRLVDDPGPAQPHTTSAKGYVLQVTNASGTPVVGAAVALRLPEDGPTGRFANGLRAWVAYSDMAGIARFPVIEWGETPGAVELKVTAAKGSNHAALMVAQRIGIDPGSVSVVSVPFQKPASVVVPRASVNQATQAPPEEPVADLPSVARQAVLGFNLPVETAEADGDLAPRPAPPQAPQVAVAAIPSPVIPPLADTPPPTPRVTAATSPDAPQPSGINIAHSGVSPDPSKPHTLTPNPPAPAKEASSEPTVTITNTTTGAGSSESHKKMWIVLAVAGGAGAAALLGIMAAHSGGGAGGGGGSNSGVTVGTPTISVGH